MEEIEELWMINKKILKEKDEQNTKLKEGNRQNIAMNKNIKEVCCTDSNKVISYSNCMSLCFS